jgi:phage FluMu gp28-like protein
MTVQRNTLLRGLSPEELESLYARLSAMPGGPSLANIQTLGAEYLDQPISKHTASSLRPHYARWQERIERRKSAAQWIAQHSAPEDAQRLADAAGHELSQQVFEFLAEADIDLTSEEGLAQASVLSRVVAQQRQGDHRLRQLELRLKAAEDQAKAATGTLTDTTLTDTAKAARLREVFGLTSIIAATLTLLSLLLAWSTPSPQLTMTTPPSFERIRHQLQQAPDCTLGQANEQLHQRLIAHTGGNVNGWRNPWPSTHPYSLLMEYQARYVLDQARFKAGLQARQTGKDFATQGEIVADCLATPKREWMVAAPSERQSLDSLDKAKDWAEAFGLAIADYKEDRAGTSETLLKAAEVTFSNGSKIRAVPGKPDTVRGRSASVMLTEFDFFERPAETWRAILPSITNPLKGGQKLVRLVSTPNGKASALHKIWTQEPTAKMAWSRHLTSIYRAVLHGLPIDIEQLREAFGQDHDGFAQEMLCEWLDSSSVLLPYDLIANAESHDATEVWDGWGQPQSHPLYIGIDFGRQSDPTVCVTLQRVGDVYWTREILVLRQMPTDEQERILSPRIAQAQRAALDYTGPGIGLGDYLAKTHGEYAPEQHKQGKIQLQTFTASWKRLAYPRLRRAFEAPCKLRVPVSIELREDLHAVQQVGRTTGYSYDSPRSAKGHSDRASAYVLAWGIAQDAGDSLGVSSLTRTLTRSTPGMYPRIRRRAPLT